MSPGRILSGSGKPWEGHAQLAFLFSQFICETANLQSVDNLKGPFKPGLSVVLCLFTVNTLGEEKLITEKYQPEWVWQDLITLGRNHRYKPCQQLHDANRRGGDTLWEFEPML